MTDSEKVQCIKEHRLFTRTKTEWDNKYNHFLNDSDILSHIRKKCEALYPYVDIDEFLESYSAFASGTELKKTLTPKRNPFGGRMRGTKDHEFFISIMRYLLGVDEMPGKLTKPDANNVEMLSQLDPALVFLVYYRAAEKANKETGLPDEYGEPFLSPFSSKDGDKENKTDLYSTTIEGLKETLGRLYPRGAFYEVNPFLEKECKNLEARTTGPTAKRVAIMDIINLVSGVCSNIAVNTRTDALRSVNDRLMGRSVDIELPKTRLWRTNRGEFCHIEAFADGYLFTRCFPKNGSKHRESIYVMTFFDDNGQMVAYAERADVFRTLVEGKNITSQKAAYYSLKLYDEDGSLLTGITTETFRPARIAFDKYVGSNGKVLSFQSLVIDKSVVKSNYVGNEDYATTTADDDFTPRPLVWMISRDYIYVQCQTEAAENGTDFRTSHITSWYRLPRFASYETWLGDTTDLLSVGDGDVVALRRFREKDGVWREFLVFSNLSLAIEVTNIKRPSPGYEFPCGVVIVKSPNQTLYSSGHDSFLTVDKAVFCPDSDGKPMAEVSYLVLSRDDTGTPKSITATEEVVVVK